MLLFVEESLWLLWLFSMFLLAGMAMVVDKSKTRLGIFYNSLFLCITKIKT